MGGHISGTSKDSKAFILEGMEFITVGSFDVRKPGRIGIGYKGFVKGTVGKEKVFLEITLRYQQGIIFRILRWDLTLDMIFWIWGVKEKCV